MNNLEKIFFENNGLIIIDTDDSYFSFIDRHEKNILDLFRNGAYSNSTSGKIRCVNDYLLQNNLEVQFNNNYDRKLLIQELDWIEAYSDISSAIDKIERIKESMDSFIQENNVNMNKNDLKQSINNWINILTNIITNLDEENY
jgi:hypothetical protein